MRVLLAEHVTDEVCTCGSPSLAAHRWSLVLKQSEFMLIVVRLLCARQLQFVVQAMDLFRQVDLSSKGVITFPEFSGQSRPFSLCLLPRYVASSAHFGSCRCSAWLAPDHIMHLDVLSDEAVLFRSFRYKRCLDVLDDFQGNTVSHLSYYPAPVDRLLVVTEVRETLVRLEQQGRHATISSPY